MIEERRARQRVPPSRSAAIVDMLEPFLERDRRDPHADPAAAELTKSPKIAARLRPEHQFGDRATIVISMLGARKS